jgi:hypothetical protein
VRNAILEAGNGVTIILTSSGIDSLAASRDAACRRAAKPHASPDAIGLRAPPQSKTSISLASHQAAIEYMANVRSYGTDAKRYFSPGSLKKLDSPEDGPAEYECRFKESADAIAAGGQSVKYEMCEGRGRVPCPYKPVCRAAEGMIGVKTARVATSNHASMATLDDAAGTTGILVVHDPPDVLETISFSHRELEEALSDLSMFEAYYRACMRPALLALGVWMREIGKAYEPVNVTDIFVQADDAIDPDELRSACRAANVEPDNDPVLNLLLCVKMATVNNERGNAPPALRSQMIQARHSTMLALRIGIASKVMYALWRMVTRRDTPYAMVLMRRGNDRVLTATGPLDPYITALTRQGSTVIVAQSVDMESIEKVTGYEPKVHRIHLPVVKNIDRTMYRWDHGNRKHLLSRSGYIRWRELRGPLKAVLDWLLDRPVIASAAIVAFEPITLACQFALAPPDGTEAAAIEGMWRAHKWPAKALQEAAKGLLDVLAKIPKFVVWVHYGANQRLGKHDALASIGDPFFSQARAEVEGSYLGLDAAGVFRRQEAQCGMTLARLHAEVAHAHARSHASLLHVGQVLPADPDWNDAHVVALGMRPQRVVRFEDFKAVALRTGLSQREIAKALDVTPGSVSRWMTGQMTVSREIFDKLSKLPLNK